MKKANPRKMIEIQSWDEVPEFTSEADEAEYWGTHGLGQALLDQMSPLSSDDLPPPRPPTRPIAINLDEDTLRRLRAVAYEKGKGYQTLLKEFVIERLYEEEKRSRMVG
jgi:CopG antitoxin of type II toxin-antitoxin system